MIGRPRWRWLAWISGGILVIGASIAGIGAALPQAHTARASAVIAAPPDSVWAVVRDIGGYASWWDWMESATLLDDTHGEVWRETGEHHMVMTMRVEESAPHVLTSTILDEDLPFGGSWTYEVTPAESGSIVTVTENGVIHNPVFRFMARFVFGYDGTIKDYLGALSARFAS